MIKLSIMTAAIFLAGAASAAAKDTIASQRWEKRIVIVFAPEGDRRIAEQKAILMQDQPGLDERELMAFAVGSRDLEALYGDVPRAETAEGLRQKYKIPASSAFTAILIGKDGGVKWRGDRPVREAELFGLIDAMPMRR